MSYLCSRLSCHKDFLSAHAFSEFTAKLPDSVIQNKTGSFVAAQPSKEFSFINTGNTQGLKDELKLDLLRSHLGEC